MKFSNFLRYAAPAVALTAVGWLAIDSMPKEAVSQSAMLQDGEIGFVVYGFGNGAQHGVTSCPDGYSIGYQQIYERSPEGQRREGEADSAYAARVQGGAFAMARRGAPSGQNLCSNPELGDDPNYRTMTATNVVSYGIDLDGDNTRANGRPPAGQCAHADFPGMNGRSGIDNQYLRVVGCTGNQRRSELEASNTALTNDDLPPYSGAAAEGSILGGGWGLLVRLRGVDDLRNDPDVQVGIYGNADPIQLSPARQPVPNATYAMSQDPKFRTEVRGRIVNGVLTTEPGSYVFPWIVAGLHLERPVNHAVMRLTFTPDGGIEGWLGGYVPVEALYDLQYGFRNARNDAGQPIPPAMTSGLGIGGSSVMGRTCEGAYDALYQHADGDYDAATGRCTSVSAQYWIRAVPAFVVDTESSSVNDDLIQR